VMAAPSRCLAGRLVRRRGGRNVGRVRGRLPPGTRVRGVNLRSICCLILVRTRGDRRGSRADGPVTCDRARGLGWSLGSSALSSWTPLRPRMHVLRPQRDRRRDADIPVTYSRPRSRRSPAPDSGTGG
jgi:hypothetical protein